MRENRRLVEQLWHATGFTHHGLGIESVRDLHPRSPEDFLVRQDRQQAAMLPLRRQGATAEHGLVLLATDSSEGALRAT
jgi:hypothetical protein